MKSKKNMASNSRSMEYKNDISAVIKVWLKMLLVIIILPLICFSCKNKESESKDQKLEILVNEQKVLLGGQDYIGAPRPSDILKLVQFDLAEFVLSDPGDSKVLPIWTIDGQPGSRKRGARARFDFEKTGETKINVAMGSKEYFIWVDVQEAEIKPPPLTDTEEYFAVLPEQPVRTTRPATGSTSTPDTDSEISQSLISDIADLREKLIEMQNDLQFMAYDDASISSMKEYREILDTAAIELRNISAYYDDRTSRLKVPAGVARGRLADSQKNYRTLVGKFGALKEKAAREPVATPAIEVPEEFVYPGMTGYQRRSCGGIKKATAESWVKINPKKPMELQYMRVYALKDGKARVRFSSSDGKISWTLPTIDLIAGSTPEINFQGYSDVLLPGVSYTVTISSAGGEFEIEDLSGCQPEQRGNNDMGLEYGGAGKVFFDINYLY